LAQPKPPVDEPELAAAEHDDDDIFDTPPPPVPTNTLNYDNRNVPPVRGSSEGSANVTKKHKKKSSSSSVSGENKENGGVQRLNKESMSNRDYFRAWDAFDVEAAEAALDENDEKAKQDALNRRKKMEELKEKNRQRRLAEIEALREKMNYDEMSDVDRKYTSLREKNKGNECFRAGENEEAVLYYSRSLALDNSSAVVFANRAMANIRLNNFDQAVDDCTQALEIDPTYVKALSRRGMVHHRCGRYSLAEADFRQCLVRDPENKEIASLLARSEQKRRELSGDIKHQQTKKKVVIVETDSESEEGDDEEEVLELGTDGGFDISDQPAKVAKKTKTKTNAKNAKNEKVPTKKAVAPPVSKVFKKVQIIEDDDSDSDSDGDGVDADSSPSPEARAESLKNDGNQAMAKKEYPLAVGLYTEALKLIEGDKSSLSASIYNNRSLAHLKLANPSNALSDSTMCLEIDPKNIKGLHRAGLALKLSGDLMGAREKFVAVLAMEPANLAAKSEKEEVESKFAENNSHAAHAAHEHQKAETKKTKKITIVEDSESSSEEEAEVKKSSQHSKSPTKKPTEPKTVSPEKALKIPSSNPKSTSEMETAVRSLARDNRFVVQYLGTFKQATFKKCFKETIDPTLLSTIFVAIDSQFEQQEKECSKILLSISKVAKAFKMVMMVLEDEGKSALRSAIGSASKLSQEKGYEKAMLELFGL